MTQLNQIYKCSICGNIVEMIHTGVGELVCCGQPMKLQTENTVNASLEKHVPVIKKTDNGIKVTVGSVAHPMDDDHYIEWIEMIVDSPQFGEAGGRVGRKFLKPGNEPVAEFCTKADKYEIRAYCNLHGLWKA